MPAPVAPSSVSTMASRTPAFSSSSGPYTNPRTAMFGDSHAGSSGSQRGYGAGGGGGGGGGGGVEVLRRSSVAASYSSTSTMPFDMLQFPNDRERDPERQMGSRLSVIREDANVPQGMSPARGGTPIGPNPPINYAQAERSDGVEGWRSGVVCSFSHSF
jgi:hypothetical protein